MTKLNASNKDHIYLQNLNHILNVTTVWKGIFKGNPRENLECGPAQPSMLCNFVCLILRTLHIVWRSVERSVLGSNILSLALSGGRIGKDRLGPGWAQADLFPVDLGI